MASPLVPVLEHVGSGASLRQSVCRDTCAFDPAAEWHHARLRTLEADQDALLEFFELAITWHELDYSEAGVIPPDQWMTFVENHSWTDRDRIERIFRLATDVVAASRRATREPSTPIPPGCPASQDEPSGSRPSVVDTAI